MNLRDRWRYTTRSGRWWYKLDAETKLVIFAMLNLAVALLICAWDTWIR